MASAESSTSEDVRNVDMSQLKTKSHSVGSYIAHSSWFYPILGIHYFFTHAFLWPLLRARLLPCLLLSIFVFLNLFLWAYLPQVAFLALFHPGHSAFVSGAFLCLEEGAIITSLLFEAFLVDETLVDVFDSILVNEGLQALVAASRPVESDTVDNPRERLGRPSKAAVYGPFSLIQIIELIILLPLNFIPFVGIPLYLLVTGRRAGPLQHWRYFKLLGWSKKERSRFVASKRLSYTWFGTMALLLQFLPPLSMLFLFTTAAGSALWVVDIEKSRAGSKAHLPGESQSERYTDD